ncbi:hypothetical protein LTS08_007399 [Lithohypha guttulata]|uniref:Cysteine-rich transmembrane CYSTM domain-containing protein n=1 Tax=Lithohypha guttulata TaxID=1690604 RepID=A0AAN7T8B0_9EURO|nr:hypothetical protein LTR51_002234 [Lithohypha guttulata]KAK5090041.1 hypothetical protein LTR05_000210 [Lithohypha guttulata]KAK5096909.1 hypothetical protein LTS08_007399 [Lithohypha guttulata]
MDPSQNKYNPPAGLPPSYPAPAQQHYDAGPFPQQWQQPQGQGQWQQYQGGPGYGPPNSYYGPPQGMQGMQYQQQPGMPPQGYVDNRKGPGAGEGCCAALLGALACCCCLDLLF